MKLLQSLNEAFGEHNLNIKGDIHDDTGDIKVSVEDFDVSDFEYDDADRNYHPHDPARPEPKVYSFDLKSVTFLIVEKDNNGGKKYQAEFSFSKPISLEEGHEPSDKNLLQAIRTEPFVLFDDNGEPLNDQNLKESMREIILHYVSTGKALDVIFTHQVENKRFPQ